ncbi:MAG TPA: protein translocase subunit SecD [Lachnospiraceae bacterium]|nr:protein translocase subunit SecD [Lachnospiraceae bacterium]
MKKSRAIVYLLVFILVLAGVTYVDFKGIDGVGTVSASDITLGLDLAGGVSITYQVVGDEAPDSTDMQDTISKLQQRVYNYSNEALVYKEGTDRISIEIPGVSDANVILEELGKPGTMYFIYQKGSDGTDNYTSSYGTDEDGNYVVTYNLNKSIAELEADGSIPLYGSDVADAQASSLQDQTLGNTQFCVDLVMTEAGKQKFADATTRAAAGGETLAIYYDGKFLSVPSVSGPLTDGRAQISGNFTFDGANKLASQIRIGGLKLELEELHSKVVGAQLGSEAISTSIKAGVIGIAAIVIFMVAVYFISGFAASLALLLYTALMVLLLNGFDITLTLPGIAGIILSIGMAVDANVIIFARVREELATGKTVQSAVKIGFEKALSAIIDGNVTTLIAAAVLWILGSGSIRGFAQTLVLGIALTMFTALTITRMLINSLYALGFKDVKWFGVAKEKKAFDFVGKRVIFITIALVCVASGFVAMGIYKINTGSALNYSLDFVGGTSVSVTFNEQMSLSDIEENVIPKLEDITGSAVQPQPVLGTNEVVFKSNAMNRDQRAQMEVMFADDFGVSVSQIVSETISSTVSDEMKTETILAVVIAIICMLIYIRIRFKDICFGASSIIPLCHDVLIVLAFYAIARISVGSTFIACILTIIGYSINATIVIFDRVRENKNIMGNKDLKEIINISITQTLSRSIFTSLTTFIMVAAVYVLGVTAIREFALPLMVGITCGGLSSVFLAGNIYYMMRKGKKD